MMFYDMRNCIVCTILAVSAWLLPACTAGASSGAVDALSSTETLAIEQTTDWISFRLKGVELRTGLMFYPGGFVDPRAYAPFCRALAEKGYFVVIVYMPLDLAVLNPAAGTAAYREHRFIRKWAIGGHSLGGAMAARFAHQDSTLFRGLLLFASYPDGSNDLSKRGITVSSISASLDGLATPDKIAETKKLLPSTTEYVVIDGGNHAHFGSYGKQARDNDATISAAAQQVIMLEATLRLLKRL
jgi:Alpha/beta hydrolase family